jgi:hypothetical protein
MASSPEQGVRAFHVAVEDRFHQALHRLIRIIIFKRECEMI